MCLVEHAHQPGAAAERAWRSCNAGDAAAVSAQLHALAEALQVVAAGRSADEVVADMAAKADALLAQLPRNYSEPLLRRDALSDAQVSLSSLIARYQDLAVSW